MSQGGSSLGAVESSRGSVHCISKISYVLDRLCSRVEKIHLLGPSLGVVKALFTKIEECEEAGTDVSVDTYAYMAAQSRDGKRRVPSSREVAIERLRAWLKK